MHPPADLELLLRLVLAAALGGVPGLERQIRRFPAGLRTHMLVALGAAAFSIAGAYGYPLIGNARDPARVAAQIVTGVGFLGAGTIWRSGSSVHGLTTAASIWVAAAIGLLAGTGLYLLAGGVTVCAALILLAMKGIEQETGTADEGRPSDVTPVGAPTAAESPASSSGRPRTQDS